MYAEHGLCAGESTFVPAETVWAVAQVSLLAAGNAGSSWTTALVVVTGAPHDPVTTALYIPASAGVRFGLIRSCCVVDPLITDPPAVNPSNNGEPSLYH